jgi:hypothetical protein
VTHDFKSRSSTIRPSSIYYWLVPRKCSNARNKRNSGVAVNVLFHTIIWSEGILGSIPKRQTENIFRLNQTDSLLECWIGKVTLLVVQRRKHEMNNWSVVQDNLPFSLLVVLRLDVLRIAWHCLQFCTSSEPPL